MKTPSPPLSSNALVLRKEQENPSPGIFNKRRYSASPFTLNLDRIRTLVEEPSRNAKRPQRRRSSCVAINILTKTKTQLHNLPTISPAFLNLQRANTILPLTSRDRGRVYSDAEEHKRKVLVPPLNLPSMQKVRAKISQIIKDRKDERSSNRKLESGGVAFSTLRVACASPHEFCVESAKNDAGHVKIAADSGFCSVVQKTIEHLKKTRRMYRKGRVACTQRVVHK